MTSTQISKCQHSALSQACQRQEISGKLVLRDAKAYSLPEEHKFTSSHIPDRSAYFRKSFHLWARTIQHVCLLTCDTNQLVCTVLLAC